MFDTCQLLLTSDISSNLGSACVWDYKTGTSLHCYKNGGILNPHTLTLIGEDYFLAAERAKPLIHVWQVNSQETLKNSKIICSGQATALAASPDGQYCVAGIGEQLNVWQIATGKLLGVVSRHFQPITKIAFTPDGSFVVSAGEDGLVLVWPLNRLVSQTSTSGQIEPLHVLSDHSLPIRDLCISVGAVDTRISTVSADCTLKIHQLMSGELLLSAVFNESLTALDAGASGAIIFVGTTSGAIHELNLMNPSRGKVFHVDSNGDKSGAFSGHTKCISALSVSADGLTLASGSADGLVIIWHIPSRQKLKTIPHGNSVNNVLFIPAIKNIFADELRQTSVFQNFQRSLATDDVQKAVHVIHKEDLDLPFKEILQNTQGISDNMQIETASYQSKIDELKTINHQLYQFSLERILKKTNSDINTVGTKSKSHVAKKKKKIVLDDSSKPIDSVDKCKLKRKHVE